MAHPDHDEFLRNSENPYEMIVLAAREAERINASRIGPIEGKPTSMAIERLARGEVARRTDAPDASANDPSEPPAAA
jgi:DNA-directed RNA polymerase subunit K/omega